ncbi:SbtR family transcriptional regulator [Streptomyces avermitilis]
MTFAGVSSTGELATAAGANVHASLQEPTMEIQARLADLLTGAQQEGAVRPELGLPEFIALLAGVGRAMEQLGADPAPRERIFEVVFDGLRPR